MATSLQVPTRLVAVSVLLSLLAVSVSSAVPHPDDCHAETCAAGGPHDPEAHRVGPAAPHDAHQHCAVCHWARAFRQTGGVSQACASPPEHDLRVQACDHVPLRVVQAAQPPLRSPPSASPAHVH